MRVKKLDMYRSNASSAATSRLGWKEYGSPAPSAESSFRGLQESDKLPEPIFTPPPSGALGPRRDIDFDTAPRRSESAADGELRRISIEIYVPSATTRRKGHPPGRHKFEFAARRRRDLSGTRS